MNQFKFRYFQIRQFVKFYWSAQTIYQMHSPFLYEFCQNILDDQRYFYAFDEIEWIRAGLLQENSLVEASAFGAGSKVGEAEQKSVSDIVKNTAISPTFGRLLFRIVHFYKYKKLIEFGTCLGVSSSYLCSPSKEIQLITVEGSRPVAGYAAQVFEHLNLENVGIFLASFDDAIEQIVPEKGPFDLVYLDGHHEKEATLRYFEALEPYISRKGMLIIDDIHWSKGMTEAWKRLQEHPKVTLSINLFQIGILFFDPNFMQKQTVNLVSLRFKPWKRFF